MNTHINSLFIHFHNDSKTNRKNHMTTPCPSRAFSFLSRPAHAVRSLIAALLCGIALPVTAGTDNRGPEVPNGLAVPEGQKVSFHAYAIGVQIYVATPSPADPTKFVWTFRAPEAVLFDNEGAAVGIHYAGPTWETESGSRVVGARMAGATVDATAIPWLLLRAVSTQGPGVLERTTYIQRVNTVGGLAPAAPPTQAGEEARVPYTADYYFFREAQ
jgi:hypothetical protein